MTLSIQIPEGILSFCTRCSESLREVAEPTDMVEIVSHEFPSLSLDKALFTGIVDNLVNGAKYPDLHQTTMFDNEVVLYFDPDRLYSLRLFLWEPGEYTNVHDHGSWGVIGPVSGELDVVNYRREDDGSNEQYANLVESERLKVQPGQSTFTLPLNEGIHKVGNPTGNAIVSLSLYGHGIPRGYINGFNLKTGRVYRILAPSTRKRLLAMEALPGLEKSIGTSALKKAQQHPLEVFRAASTAALAKLQ